MARKKASRPRKPTKAAAKAIQNAAIKAVNEFTAKHQGKLQSPEERLAKYWRKKAGIKFSDFDAILGEHWPVGVRSRFHALDLKHNRNALRDLEIQLAEMLWQGFPLSKDEYHLAIACHLLITEAPYEEFYMTHWFESKDRRGYGNPAAPGGGPGSFNPKT